MERRKALRTIGFGTTAISVTPAVVGMLQSCQSKNNTFKPIHFSKDQFSVLSKLMDLIIPETDIPGAIQLNLPEFLDGFIGAIFSAKAKENIAKELDCFITVALEDSPKDSASSLSTEDLDSQLAKYLKADQKQQKRWKKQKIAYSIAVKKDISLDPPVKAIAHSFLLELRSLTINAFKTNKFIGENVLAYLPIPGRYSGCVDLNETTGGKAWSI